MKFLFICFSFIGLVCLSSCENSQAQAFHASLSGQVYVSDTMLYKDHSYILVRHSMTQDFQVLHSPDCFCRYNRKFIVVKHSK